MQQKNFKDANVKKKCRIFRRKLSCRISPIHEIQSQLLVQWSLLYLWEELYIVLSGCSIWCSVSGLIACLLGPLCSVCLYWGGYCLGYWHHYQRLVLYPYFGYTYTCGIIMLEKLLNHELKAIINRQLYFWLLLSWLKTAEKPLSSSSRE